MKTNILALKFIRIYSILLFLFFIQNTAGSLYENSLKTVISDTVFRSYVGKIVNDKSEPLAYASISVENSKISTVSNADGEFLIKVPFEYQRSNVLVSFLGYENLIIPISNLQESGNRLVLKLATVVLPDLHVILEDPSAIVKKMLDSRYAHYSNKDVIMTAFYRETIKNRNRNVSLAEAIVDVYKRGYTSGLHDMASLYKSRKSTDYNRLDTLVFKLMGGPFNTIYLDVMRYPEYILTENAFDSYSFRFLKTDVIQDRHVYIIEFEPLGHVDVLLYYGKLYVDIESFALVKAEFDLDLKDKVEASKIFIKRKPVNARVETTKAHYELNYLLVDDIWYHNYSRIELDLKINWKKKLFNTIYRTVIEMATTDWTDKTNKKEFKLKGRITPAVIIQNEASGFADADFWGEYNIIEPDKSIENAIDKISRQLNKK